MKFTFLKSMPVCHIIYIKLEGKKSSEHRRNCYNLLDDQSINLVNSNQIYNIIYNICYDLLLDFFCRYVATHQIQKEIFSENSFYTEFRYAFCYSPSSLRAWEALGEETDKMITGRKLWDDSGKNLWISGTFTCVIGRHPLETEWEKKPWR